MPVYTVELTDAEVKAMELVVPDAQEWITNAVFGKVSKCIERVLIEYDLTPTRAEKLSAQEKEQIILAANVKSRKERDAVELEAMIANLRIGGSE